MSRLPTIIQNEILLLCWTLKIGEKSTLYTFKEKCSISLVCRHWFKQGQILCSRFIERSIDIMNHEIQDYTSHLTNKYCIIQSLSTIDTTFYKSTPTIMDKLLKRSPIQVNYQYLKKVLKQLSKTKNKKDKNKDQCKSDIIGLSLELPVRLFGFVTCLKCKSFNRYYEGHQNLPSIYQTILDIKQLLLRNNQNNNNKKEEAEKGDTDDIEIKKINYITIGRDSDMVYFLNSSNLVQVINQFSTSTDHSPISLERLSLTIHAFDLLTDLFNNHQSTLKQVNLRIATHAIPIQFINSLPSGLEALKALFYANGGSVGMCGEFTDYVAKINGFAYNQLTTQCPKLKSLAMNNIELDATYFTYIQNNNNIKDLSNQNIYPLLDPVIFHKENIHRWYIDEFDGGPDIDPKQYPNVTYLKTRSVSVNWNSFLSLQVLIIDNFIVEDYKMDKIKQVLHHDSIRLKELRVSASWSQEPQLESLLRMINSMTYQIPYIWINFKLLNEPISIDLTKLDISSLLSSYTYQLNQFDSRHPMELRPKYCTN